MMKLQVPCAVLGAALVLAAGASTAQAAKGVKKNVANATTVYGQVVSVNHGNAGGGKGAAGSFMLKTAQNHKKRGVAGNNAGVAGGRNTGHEFHVTSATRFEGPNHTQASFAAMQKGERVHVRAQGQQAQNVQIASNHRSYGRSRGMVQRHNQQHYHVRHASAARPRPVAAHHKSKKK